MGPANFGPGRAGAPRLSRVPHDDPTLVAERFEADRMAAIQATDEYRRLAESADTSAEQHALEHARDPTEEAVRSLECLLSQSRIC
jgi:hypothetical protein